MKTIRDGSPLGEIDPSASLDSFMVKQMQLRFKSVKVGTLNKRSQFLNNSNMSIRPQATVRPPCAKFA